MAATSERKERELYRQPTSSNDASTAQSGGDGGRLAQLLSRHETVAVYRGIEMGSEDLRRSFPQQPRKEWAVFEIERYLSLEKTGEEGDGEQSAFKIVVDDTNLSSALALSALRQGQRVLLSWNHEYVIRWAPAADGRELRRASQERVVTKLAPLEDSER